MLAALGTFLLVAAFFGGIAWGADATRWSALALHTEPLLLLVLALAAYRALVGRRWGVVAGLALGAPVGAALLRIPASPAVAQHEPPLWGRAVQSCASMLSAPNASVDFLQWTLSDGTPEADVRHAVTIIDPDVVVLFNLADPGVLETMVEEEGGEAHFYPPQAAGGGFGVYTRGAFQICGEADEWTEALDSAGGYAVSFVGLVGDLVFPLVVARFPGPLVAGDFGTVLRSASTRVTDALDVLDVPGVVLLADAPVTSTYRDLLGSIRGTGLVSVPSPPNWPAHLGRLRLLPVHAYDRAWAGPGWTTVASRRIGVASGTRAPVWTRLGPGTRTATTPR